MIKVVDILISRFQLYAVLYKYSRKKQDILTLKVQNQRTAAVIIFGAGFTQTVYFT